MAKALIISIGAGLVFLIYIIILLKILSKKKKEIKSLEKRLEGNKNAKKVKDEIRTGSNSDMFDNSIDKLQEYAERN